MSNTLPASEASKISDPVFIDVLPRDGQSGTDYAGSFSFVDATVTDGGSTVEIQYSSSSGVQTDPKDPSNAAAGSTTWCDAPSAGTVVSGSGACPASADEVTALRVIRPGLYDPGQEIAIELAMVGVGNQAGDQYMNWTSAAAAGLDSTVGPVRRPETVISSSMGNYTWWDFNRNGVQDDYKGEAEQAATGVTVRISGTDDLGNTVDLETQTDASGNYVFPGLRSSDANGYVVTFMAPDGSVITEQAATGSDARTDSDADPATGATAPFVLGTNIQDTSLDAGFMPEGSLRMNKALSGAGAGTFATGDTLTFDAVCTFDSGLAGSTPTEVLNEEITFTVTDPSAPLTSSVMEDLPAFTECTITETASGSADEAADPAIVTIPWDVAAETSDLVTASMTNYYSAGSIQLTKQLEGDAEAVNLVQDVAFEILVTCQIEEKDAAGAPVISDLYSGIVKIKGGQTKFFGDASRSPHVLPLGATCYGEEVDSGGAAQITISATDFENGVQVTSGEAADLQQLEIVAVNTFEATGTPGEGGNGGNPSETCAGCLPGLPITGGQAASAALFVAGALLLGGLLLWRRRHSLANTTHVHTG